MNDFIDFKKYWERNITGKGVKIAVFDTGISESYFQNNDKNVKERKNWSSKKNYTGMDFDGHGTFVAGVRIGWKRFWQLTLSCTQFR